MPARSADAAPVAIEAQRLVSAVADIFKAVGIAAEDAQVVAADLVAADLEGIASHGVMLLPMYVERIVKEGYRFLMCAPVRSYGNLDKAREATGLA